MFDSSPANTPASAAPIVAEYLTKALHSAQFLQADLQQVLANADPFLAELVLLDLAAVNGVLVRLQHIESLARNLA